MFIYKKINASGSTSIQIIQKTNGKNKIIKVIGSSKDANKIEELYELGINEIKSLQQALELPFYETLEHFVLKRKVEELIVVADAGLLSQKNMKGLVFKGYKYILGARIKNESKGIREQILAFQLRDKENVLVDREDGSKLIISYKKSRAINDAKNRKRG